jgi:hypothetical protein
MFPPTFPICAPQERVVKDDKLKTQYKGITGMTVWTPDYKQLRLINLEIKIAGKGKQLNYFVRKNRQK